MKSKKAQVTIFIIVGIIILAIIASFLVFRKEMITGELTPEIELTIGEVPIEFRPVDIFIKGCIQQIAEEGIRKLGERGGFISPSRYGLSTNDIPTESDAVRRSPTADYSIPYWFYMKSPNNCYGQCDFLSIPDNVLFLYRAEGDPSIERQIEEYINYNLDSCLNDFQTLKAQGFSVEKLGSVNTQVSIKDTEVLILVEYPLKVEKESTKEISQFFARVPVHLKEIYELAREITQLQRDYHYLERHLKNLIVGFASVNNNKLPPMHETVLRLGGETTWPVDMVELQLQHVISSYAQALQVANTANYAARYTRNQLSDALYNNGMLLPVEGIYPDLEASFAYYPDWWPMYFDIDCQGGVCHPEPFSSTLGIPIGIQRYSFAYDISFPVEIIINDPSAFNNRGYSFSFLLEANMRDNEPMTANYLPAPMIQNIDSDFCDESKRTSEDITITVFDADNYKLDEASVVYTCIGEDSCLIGKTENGVLTARFPPCLGGILSVLKDGYLGQSKPLDVEIGSSDSLKFSLNPTMLKKFIVKKKMIEKTRVGNTYFWKPTMNITDLKPNERAVVLLEKVESVQEEAFKSGGNYEGNQTEPSEILIGAGTFKATIHLMLDEKISIPAKGIYPSQTFPEPYISGGLVYNFTFSNYNLENADTITFYALSPNLYEIPEEERSIMDITEIGDIQKLSEMYGYAAWPTFD